MPRRRWLVIARDEQLGGSHILILYAPNIKEAYKKCARECLDRGMKVPDKRAAYELKGNGAAHICTVLDVQNKEGLFNGRTPLSIGPAGSGGRRKRA